MENNAHNNDQNKFIIAEKQTIYAGILIIVGLVIFIMVEDIHNLPPDNLSQKSSLKTLQKTPANQVATLPGALQTVRASASDAQEVPVEFHVNGRITQMLFAEHAAVKQGEILATLDKAPFEEALTSAMSKLQTAQTNYTTNLPTSSFNAIEAARLNVENMQHNFDAAHAELEERRKLITAGQLDNVYNDDVQNEHDAELNLERSRRELVQQQDSAANNPDRDEDKAAVQFAEINLAAAEKNLIDTQLLAPAAGIVAKRIGEVGATVSAGAVIYTLSVPVTAASNPSDTINSNTCSLSPPE